MISFILFCCFVQITTELKAEPAITSIGGVTVVSNGSWPEIVTDTSQNEEVFVDSALKDLGSLKSLHRPGTRLIYLDRGVDPLDQIAATLRGTHNVKAVHIFSHGQADVFSIAGRTYDSDSLLEQHRQALADIGRALKPGGDILFYGCDLAAGLEGRGVLSTIARLTGADVAASVDITGFTGNWDLEWNSGQIEMAAIAAPEWLGKLWTTTFSEAGWFGDSPPLTPNAYLLPGSRFSSAGPMSAGTPAATFDMISLGGPTVQRLSAVNATSYASAVSNGEYITATLVVGSANGATISAMSYNQRSENGNNATMVVAIYDPVTSILTPITGSVAIDGTTNIVPIPIATQVGLAPGQTYEIRFYFYNCTTTIGGAANSCAIDNPRFSSMANEPPTAINDSFATPYLTAVSGNVTAANPTTADSDPESQTLRVD